MLILMLMLQPMLPLLLIIASLVNSANAFSTISSLRPMRIGNTRSISIQKTFHHAGRPESSLRATSSSTSSSNSMRSPLSERDDLELSSSTKLSSSSSSSSTSKAATATKKTRINVTVEGPPIDTKPDYSTIHGPLGPFVDRLFLSLFRIQLASRLKSSSSSATSSSATSTSTAPHSNLPLDDFQGIIELTSQMNSHYNNRTQIQLLAQDVLISLFPPFILNRYPSWFARPFPEFSAKMCAWATVVGGTWLMGECEVNDIPIHNNNNNNDRNNDHDSNICNDGKNQGVLVKRCRFLEESQCASICVNSCKIPTQTFFRQNMGLPLTMTPDYETGECQFSFGRVPSEEEERLAKETPCLRKCPSGGGMRSWHSGTITSNGTGNGNDGNYDDGGKWLDDLEALGKELQRENEKFEVSTSCALMED